MDDKNKTNSLPEMPSPSREQLRLQERLCAGKSVIGVDIGPQAVSVAQSAVYQGKVTLLKVAAEAIDTSKDRSREEAIGLALKTVLARVNTKKAEIMCVLPGNQTVVENICMPVMPLDELQEAVKLEVLSSQHFAIHRPAFHFQVVGRIVDKGVEKLNVALAVASQASIDSLLARFMPLKAKPLAGQPKTVLAMAPLGLNVAGIIPSAIAIENIIKKSKLKVDETLAVLDMGAISTELNIYRDAHLALSRQIPVTNFDLTRALMGAFFGNTGKVELTSEEADRIKYEYGIPLPGDDLLIEKKITSHQVSSLLRPRLEQLAGEVRRSFDYYSEKTPAGKVDRLIIFGSGARIKGLAEFLGSELDISVSTGDPAHDIELLFEGVLGLKEDSRKLAGAIGASLGDPKGLNLLPAHYQNRKKRFYQKMFLGTTFTIFIGILGIIYFGLLLQVDVQRAEVEAVTSEYQGLVPRLKQLKYGINLQREVKRRPDWSVLFRELSSLSDDLYLTEMDIKGNKVHFSGIVLEKDEAAKEAPNQLLLDLQSRILPDAVLLAAKQKSKKTDARRFEIEGHMGASGGASDKDR
ncbi:MAG: pilus assembly protein PilM [Candidatus Omnitrophica bacterium]|nr:pilus assembly protein PilM [Candidatus Omnitrophota bacterium]